MVATGLVNVSEIFLATRSFDSGDFGFGLLWTGSGIGLVVGGLAAGAIVGRRRPLRVYPLGFLPWAAGTTGAALAPERLGGGARDGAGRVRQRCGLPATMLIVQERRSTGCAAARSR